MGQHQHSASKSARKIRLSRRRLARGARAVAVTLSVASMLVSGLPVQGATWTWDSQSGVWSDAARWGGIAPVGNDPTDVLQFGGATSFTADNNIVGGGTGGAFQVNVLELSGTNFALSGGAMQFDGPGSEIRNLGPTGTAQWRVFNGLILNTDVTLGGTGTGTVFLNGDVSGPGRLLVGKPTGTGTFVLGGNNTHGGVTLLGGTNTAVLAVGDESALGTGSFNIDGGTVRGNRAMGAIANNVNISSTATFGQAGHQAGLHLGGPVDLGSSNRSIVVNAAELLISGTVSNGGITKAGAGGLILSGQNDYDGDTTVAGGTLTVALGGTLGADVAGNDVRVNRGTTLRLADPSALGLNQLLTLDTASATNSAPILALGAGFNGGVGIGFGTAGSGIGNIRLTNTATANRLAIVALDGANDFSTDFVASLNAIPANTRVYLGATTTNGTFTGSSLTAGVGNTYHLGGGGGTLTIENANVLTGTSNVIVGSFDGTGRGITGSVFIKDAQSYSGVTTVGNGGTLIAAGASSLGNTSGVELRGGTLDLRSDGHGLVDNQYAGINITASNNSTISLNNLRGGSSDDVRVGSLNVRQNLTITTSVSNLNNLVIDGPVTINGNLLVSSGGNLTTIAGPIVETGTSRNLGKSGTGVLKLESSNAYTGITSFAGAINSSTGAGTLLVTHTSGLGTGELRLNGNNGLSALDLRSNGAGNDGIIAFRSGNVVATGAGAGTGTNNTFTINVSRENGFNTGNTVILETAPGVGADLLIGSGTSNFVLTVSELPTYYGGQLLASDIANGETISGSDYRLRFTGNTTFSGNVTLNPTSGQLEITGPIAEAGGSRNLIKTGRGTLVLSGSNTFTGSTTINSGHLVIEHDQALGLGTSPVVMATNQDSSLLLKGERNFTHDINVTSNGGTQRIGGFGGANPKIFSGNLSLNRTIQATALAGGDVTFSGVISGAGGVTKIDSGTIFLTNSNAFTGNLTVNEGRVVGIASAAGGSPFGNHNNLVLNGGILELNGDAAGSVNVTTTGNLTAGGRGRLQLNDAALGDGFTTQLTVNNLVRSGNGTLRVVPGLGSLNGEEIVTVTGTADVVNGILAPWAVAAVSGSNDAADFIGFSGNNLTVATYGGSGDINTVGGGTSVWNVNAAGTMIGDQSVFAMKTNVATDLGGNILELGDPSAGLAGLILNDGASITNGRIRLGNVEALVYVEGGETSTIGANITGRGTGGGLNKFGAGTLVLTGTTSYRGTTDVNNGTLRLGLENALFRGFSAGALIGSAVNIEAGGVFDLGGFNQEIGTLTGDGIVQLGSATLRTGTSSGTQTFNGQIIGGAGSTFIKTGANTLTLNNTDGRTPNSVETVIVERGILQVNGQGSTSGFATPQTLAIPGTAEYILKGGQLNLNHNGDFTNSPQNLYWGNNITVLGSPSTNRVDRFAGSGSANTMVLNKLTMGDGQMLSFIAANTYNVMFSGTTTLVGDATLQVSGPQVALAGVVTDNGTGATLNRTGFSTLLFGSANNYSGGTMLSGGTAMFGVLFGNTVVYNSEGNLGTGDVVLQPGSAIRYNSTGNVSAGQNLFVTSINGQNSRVDLQFDGRLSDVNLRAMGGGSVGLNANFIYSDWDLGLIGDGTWTLGTIGTTTYDAQTLTAGAGDTYRLGGGGGSTLVINRANVLTGDNGLVVGSGVSSLGAQWVNSSGTLQLNDDQDYTGNTVIHRNTASNFTAPGATIGNALDFRGTLATGVIDVYGDLRATGRGTFTDANGVQVNTVNLHVGSTLQLNYNGAITGALQPNQSASGLTNKWQDDLGIHLRGATLDLRSASGLQTVERIGGVTAEYAAGISVLRQGTNGQAVLEIDGGLTRVGQAGLVLRTTSANELGANSGNAGRVIFVNLNDAPARGVVGGNTVNQVAAWIINGTDDRFVDYDPVNGFTNAAFTVTSGTSTFNAGANNGTDIVNTTTSTQTIAGAADIYSLRLATNNTVVSGGDLVIRSGGLIATSSNATISSNTFFGDGVTPTEAVVYNDLAQGAQITLSGSVTANGLTKLGRGTLNLTGSNNITGNIQLNNGKLVLGDVNADGSATITLGGASVTGGGSAAVELALRSNTSADFGSNVIVGNDVGLVTISVDRLTTSGSSQTLSINSLTLNTSPDQPQVVNVTSSPALGSTANNHGYLFQINGDLNLLGNGEALITTLPGSSSPTINVLGDVTGSARFVKATAGTIDLRGTNAGFTGGFTLQQGTLQVRNGFGTGDVLVNGGTLRTLSDTSASPHHFLNDGNNIRVTGSSILNFGRAAGTGGFTTQWGTANTMLTLDGSKNLVTLFEGDTGLTLQYNGQLTSLGNVTAQLNDNVQIQGGLHGNGRFSKTGLGRLTLNSAAAGTFVGEMWLNQGVTRQAVNNANARFAGEGSSIFVNPGAGITSARVESFRDGAAGPSQIERFYSTSTAPAVLGIGFNTTQEIINSAAVLDVNNIHSDPFGTAGVLGIDSTNTTALDMGSLFNGMWYLGSTVNGTYNVSTLGAGVGGVYRLGGGGGTLTISQPALRDANSVIIGLANGWGMNSQVTLAGSNTYTGGTTVVRARDGNGNNSNASLSVQGGGNTSPLGSGAVDVYGTIRFEGGNGSAVAGTDTNGSNRNTYTFHPGALLLFENNTGFNMAISGGGRWGNNDAIHLDGSTLQLIGDNANIASNTEIVGDVTFDRGSDISVTRRAPQWAELVLQSLTRVNNGTLTIAHDSGLLGVAGAANADRILVVGGVSMTNNMVAPFIVSRTQNQFLQYDATDGFKLVDTNAANYVINSTNTLAAPALNDGTEILDVNTADTTLAANLDVWALRTDRTITNSADQQFNTITIRSGGLLHNGGSTRRIDPNLNFLDSANNPIDAFILASGATLQLNGSITAANIYKMGTNVLEILADQPGFSGNWYVNQGVLSVRSPGALGSGNVVLNGGSGNGPELRIALDAGTPDPLAFTSGTITAFDNNQIRFIPGVNDRTAILGNIDLRATGTGSTPALRFLIDSSRNTLQTGNVTAFSDYVLNVDAGVSAFGASSGVVLGGLTGNNVNITKIGDGRLTLGDISSSFTGGSIRVDQGTLVATHNGSLGSASTQAIVDQGGVLQINTANFSPDANLELRPGAIERWSVDGARTGGVNLGAGVSLQVDANQTGAATIVLNGGSIAGYLENDANQLLVFRTLGSGININLIGDSFLGILHPVNTPLYDVGKFNQDTVTFSTQPAQGAILQINGNITGAFDLTKVGLDTVELSGANNTYGNTIVTSGVLRIGADDVLPLGGTLITSITGIFDLNGFNQTVANIAGDGGTIYNSSADLIKDLTVNSTNASSYGGAISGNIQLIKEGTGELTLTSTNDYRGDTHINGGLLTIGFDAALGDGDRSDIFFDGGALRTTASFSVDPRRSITLNLGGGTFETDAGTTLTLTQSLAGAGGLTKNGEGALNLFHPNTYAGNTTINDGTLRITGEDGLPTGTLLTINGGLNGGRFDMNGFNQTVANLAGNGGNVFNNIGGVKTLTITGATDSSYAGAIGPIGGSDVALVKNGAGKLTLSGNSAYVGNTTVNGGTLSVSDAANLGATPNIFLGGGTTLEVTGTSSPTFGAIVDIAAGGAALNITTTGNNASFGGLTGSGILTKNGFGQATFAQSNPGFTGALFINDGTLATTHTNGLGNAPVTTLNGTGTLLLNNTGGNVPTWTGPITSNGPDTGFDIVGGGVSFTGAMQINAGSNLNIQTNGQVLQIAAGASIGGAGNLGIEGGSTVMVNNGANALTGDVNVFGTLGGDADFQHADVIVGSGGKITPGNSIGTMHVESLTMAAGSSWDAEVAQPLSAEFTFLDNHLADLIHVDGLLDLSAANDTLNVLGLNGVVFGTFPFIIASYGTLVGTFDIVTGLIPTYSVDYNYKGLNLIAIVPEPTTLSLLGLAGLALLRRRNRK